jgi:hypothetical protein
MNTPKPLPPIEMLRLLFDYNPETGKITRKTTRGNKKLEDEVGTITTKGYRGVSISHNGKKKKYRAARIVWALYYGEDPGLMEVDHINCERDDNRICNLRLLTRGENVKARPYHIGISGEQHITITRHTRFRVRVRGIGVGITTTLEEAVRLRDEYLCTNHTTSRYGYPYL